MHCSCFSGAVSVEGRVSGSEFVRGQGLSNELMAIPRPRSSSPVYARFLLIVAPPMKTLRISTRTAECDGLFGFREDIHDSI